MVKFKQPVCWAGLGQRCHGLMREAGIGPLAKSEHLVPCQRVSSEGRDHTGGHVRIRFARLRGVDLWVSLGNIQAAIGRKSCEASAKKIDRLRLSPSGNILHSASLPRNRKRPF